MGMLTFEIDRRTWMPEQEGTLKWWNWEITPWATTNRIDKPVIERDDFKEVLTECKQFEAFFKASYESRRLSVIEKAGDEHEQPVQRQVAAPSGSMPVDIPDEANVDGDNLADEFSEDDFDGVE